MTLNWRGNWLTIRTCLARFPSSRRNSSICHHRAVSGNRKRCVACPRQQSEEANLSMWEDARVRSSNLAYTESCGQSCGKSLRYIVGSPLDRIRGDGAVPNCRLDGRATQRPASRRRTHRPGLRHHCRRTGSGSPMPGRSVLVGCRERWQLSVVALPCSHLACSCDGLSVFGIGGIVPQI